MYISKEVVMDEHNRDYLESLIQELKKTADEYMKLERGQKSDDYYTSGGFLKGRIEDLTILLKEVLNGE
jgi:F0F1-type ATP synthase epsilon subunit